MSRSRSATRSVFVRCRQLGNSCVIYNKIGCSSSESNPQLKPIILELSIRRRQSNLTTFFIFNGGSVAEWFRPPDLLSGFVLGSPEVNSSIALCK